MCIRSSGDLVRDADAKSVEDRGLTVVSTLSHLSPADIERLSSLHLGLCSYPHERRRAAAILEMEDQSDIASTMEHLHYTAF